MKLGDKLDDDRERKRKSDNVDLILSEARTGFNNQKEAWNNLDQKVFYLLGFISVFVGFIAVQNLLGIFQQEIPHLFKIVLLIGLIFIFWGGFSLIKIILPTDFKISASVKDMKSIFQKDKLAHLKFALIKIYDEMNDDNEWIMRHRANIFRGALYNVIIGVVLIFIGESFPLIKYLGGL